MSNEIKFIVQAVLWRDKVNGNTYHSVRITRTRDGKVIVHPDASYHYGYGNHYVTTALDVMIREGWIPKRYTRHEYAYERENDYPIAWIVSKGTKREMIANGTV